MLKVFGITQKQRKIAGLDGTEDAQALVGELRGGAIALVHELTGPQRREVATRFGVQLNIIAEALEEKLARTKRRPNS